MYHFTYRITNVKLNKHYYGCHSSKLEPIKILGKKYFSSSTDDEFMKDQKLNQQDYRYKIVQTFNTRIEAISLEIKLHNKFDVAVNESFYNKAKQTSTGFDTTGTVGPNKGKHHSDESKAKLRAANLGKVNGPMSLETKEKISKAKKDKPKSEEHKEKLRQANIGKKLSEETKEKISIGNLNKIVSKETGLKISEAKKGHVPSEETRKLWSAQRKGKTGRPMSEENKKNLSTERKGKQLPQGTCPHCNTITTAPLLGRYHFNKCKKYNAPTTTDPKVRAGDFTWSNTPLGF